MSTIEDEIELGGTTVSVLRDKHGGILHVLRCPNCDEEDMARGKLGSNHWRCTECGEEFWL